MNMAIVILGAIDGPQVLFTLLTSLKSIQRVGQDASLSDFDRPSQGEGVVKVRFEINLPVSKILAIVGRILRLLKSRPVWDTLRPHCPCPLFNRHQSCSVFRCLLSPVLLGLKQTECLAFSYFFMKQTALSLASIGC